MLVAIVIMWMSTVSDWIATLVAVVEDYTALQDLTLRSLRRMTDMQDCIGTLPGSDATWSCFQQAPLTTLLDSPVHSIQNCTNTAALTVNVVIGDAIVWWRAWVLWPGDSLVRCMCVVMILATMVLGAMDTATTCGAQVPGWVLINPSRVALFSLLTNAVATTLIAYRAWKHRRLIMSYLKARGSSPRTQVERTLALLVESGVLFCAFWVIIVVYEFSEVKYPAFEVSAFAHGLYYVIRGCLVPLIGMYPTVVIIVCAVNKSLYEKSARSSSEIGNASIVFNGAPPTRRRGTLSELLGAGASTE
ncbi:hypothetical protein K466DRAFT_586036 [Polyporus arcularius HHB13444]|uniref:Uncharacterized protein n=1 Tax=Polyporus arcularius HHB13444 TaxID=1314778 RepID=A0A5C3PF06_9APHY|nr:hypothetical protein K466DRAFT_586036 [Polyporus arcularius HHB13444]